MKADITDEQLRVKVEELFVLRLWYDMTDKQGDPKHQWQERDMLPNYPTSLDACAEFEQWLSLPKNHINRDNYATTLAELNGAYNDYYAGWDGDVCWLAATATARQRCIAFIQTMES